MSSTTTSRVARKPVIIPAGVNINVLDTDIKIKGAKGEISLPLHPDLNIEIDGGLLNVNISKTPRYSRSGSGNKLLNAIPGTTRAKIQNAVDGVSKGFERKLVLVGVGYRAQIKGTNLALSLGFSHPVEFVPPEGITIEAPIPTEVIIKGIDKHLVGHTASKIRAIRPPEPYKGKGVRYSDEVVVRKETKKK
jgi:large subunit ribosomal protein L6